VIQDYEMGDEFARVNDGNRHECRLRKIVTQAGFM
jgi:hypothetical protein